VKLGVVADVHGNATALHAIFADAAGRGVERWWALGDLVLFGPRPVEALESLLALPGIQFVSGNTERYVTTGAQPHPHATAADAVGDVGLVSRYGQMAAAIGWTQGALCQAGLLDEIAALPSELRLALPDGSRLLGVHASPGADDGPGIDTDSSDDVLSDLLAGCDAEVVVGGHTHIPTDRTVGAVRVLNPGSAGLPRRCVGAAWMLIDANETGIHVEHRRADFDVDEVVADLHQRRHPSAAFVEAILRRTHAFAR
jgi:predicted phosphodiesterase